MAEEPTKKKRRVRNPETFRERAIKASNEGDKPAKKTRVRQFGGRVVTPVFRPVSKAASTVVSSKPARPLRRPARIVGKIIFPTYFRHSWRELRQVEWPNWYESRRLTYAVLIFAIIFGASIAVVDYGLDKLFKNILLK